METAQAHIRFSENNRIIENFEILNKFEDIYEIIATIGQNFYH